jgi:hypothetical protein
MTTKSPRDLSERTRSGGPTNLRAHVAPIREARASKARRWHELSPEQQSAMVRLYGGGSLRKFDSLVVEGLRRSGLIDASRSGHRLTDDGRELLSERTEEINQRLVSERTPDDKAR